jgi:catechol 2,3-dioxygenase-like lactoylglutathione lyase family enzyme
MAIDIRMEGVTLTVTDVKRSIEYYRDQLGFKLEWDAAPHFAMLRIGGADGGTVGLLAWNEAKKEGAEEMGSLQAKAIHVEFSTDDLDGLYQQLLQKGVKVDIPPHDEPWERSMTVFDPDGYSVEFSQGRRGKRPDDGN